MKIYMKSTGKLFLQVIIFFVGVFIVCLLLAYLAMVLDESKGVFGNLPSWIAILMSVFTIMFSSENIKKSNQNSIKLTNNNRSVDLYVKDLRCLIDQEKLIIGSEIKTVKNIDANDINFEVLWDLIIDMKLSFSNKQNMVVRYDSKFIDVNYTIYGMPNEKKEMFDPLTKKANELLLEFSRIKSAYQNNGATYVNVTWLKNEIVNLLEIHEQILNQAVSEINKYYKIDDQYI